MGHTSISMTNHYTHRDAASLATLLDRAIPDLHDERDVIDAQVIEEEMTNVTHSRLVRMSIKKVDGPQDHHRFIDEVVTCALLGSGAAKPPPSGWTEFPDAS